MSRGLVVSATNLTERAAPNLIAGDQIVIDLFLTGQGGLQNIQDYPTVRLGIGSLNARPEGGTWDLGSETGIAYDASAASIKTAIDAEVNGCSVTQLAPLFQSKIRRKWNRAHPGSGRHRADAGIDGEHPEARHGRRIDAGGVADSLVPESHRAD